jgi:hypothetical protein
VIESKIPLGIKLPYRKGPGGYFLQTHSDMERARNNLKMLLMTAKGERPLMPTYGSDLHELLFEPNVADHMDDLFEDAVRETTTIWMPEVTITYVKVERDLINTPSTATLNIGFSITSIPNSEQILILEI